MMKKYNGANSMFPRYTQNMFSLSMLIGWFEEEKNPIQKGYPPRCERYDPEMKIHYFPCLFMFVLTYCSVLWPLLDDFFLDMLQDIDIIRVYVGF